MSGERLDWQKSYMNELRFIIRVIATHNGFVVELKDLCSFMAEQIFPKYGQSNMYPMLAIEHAKKIVDKIDKKLFKVIEKKEYSNNMYWIFEAKESVFVPADNQETK